MLKIDLAGTWSLSRKGAKDRPLPVAVPGDNASALLAAGKIPDPYDRMNELAVQGDRPRSVGI
ncbi:MAG: hypothetical protein R6X19_10430 [Kiritimatiellia bacterium]